MYGVRHCISEERVQFRTSTTYYGQCLEVPLRLDGGTEILTRRIRRPMILLWGRGLWGVAMQVYNLSAVGL